MGTFGSQSRDAISTASSWAGAKFWAGVCALGRFLQWLLVPKGDTPLDFLKHYVSVLIVLIGAGALAWSVKQIAYPPLVITVGKLPEPIEKEYWLNPELSRKLIGEIERLRAVVKGERDPAFEAVLNPPNIVVKSGEWSLDVQQQILTPLGSLLGRGQGEVHLALNCYYPGCARTTDKECRDPVPLKAPDSKVPESTVADGKTAAKQYLCLRLTADIQRGLLHDRLTSQLTVSPDDAEMTGAMARVAEAVMTVADPATATLYFYRRIREGKRNPRDPVATEDGIADLAIEASKAAEQAEQNEQTDAVSACWAHTIRAHLAVDQREFNLAETYLARARNVLSSSRFFRLTSAPDCRRLIMIAEMEFARRLAQPPRNETYPPHEENDDGIRVLAAFNRVKSLLDQQRPQGWARLFGNSTENEDDLTGALKLVQAEIGLRRVEPSVRCELLRAGRDRRPVPEEDEGAAESSPERAKARIATKAARLAIRNAIEKLVWLKPGEQLPPLTRQASLDLMSRFARNAGCAEEVVQILRKLDLNHPSDERVMQLLLAIAQEIALRKTDSLGRPAEARDRGNAMIDVARNIYQRTAATGTGSDRTVALTRLAIIAEAKRAEDDEENLSQAPNEETLQNLKRAWQRYVRDINSTRESGELIVSFWGMVLIRSYPEAILETDFSNSAGEVTVNKEYRNAIANKAVFEQALRVLYPNAYPERLADLPRLDDVGPRIGCLCMLSYVTRQSELADFFIGRLDKWQKQGFDQRACRRELIPQTQTHVPLVVANRASVAKKRLKDAEDKLQNADTKTPELQAELEERRKAHEAAQQDLRNAQKAADNALEVFRKKDKVVQDAAKVCYVDAPPAPLPPRP